MQSVARFRVVSPFLAVRLVMQKERFVTVPVGAIVETSADTQDPGLIPVSLNGENLLAFRRDIIERSERVEHLVPGSLNRSTALYDLPQTRRAV